MSRQDNPLVYSTDIGRIKPPDPTVAPKLLTKGVRIQRQTSGRKGKGVSIITGLNLSTSELEQLAAMLKKKCGCGGTVAGESIEIQGDKREQLLKLLNAIGIEAKLSGG